jgi:hypothetical protein
MKQVCSIHQLYLIYLFFQNYLPLLLAAIVVLCIHQNTLKTAPQRVWLGVKKITPTWTAN